MAETFHGYIETTQDVLLIFEGCRRGLIPRVCRRLQEKERRMIRSGSVFVFDERESGIKRWTDGLVWSPSRILGNFLIYRELDKRVPGDKKLSISSQSSNDARQRSYSADQTAVLTSGMSTSNDRSNRERRLVGSLSDSYRFRKDGLIKKTMSIIVNGVAQHLISYYLPSDIISNKLRTPSSVPELASLEISPDLLVKQNFRIPPMVEPPFDQTEAGLTGGIGSVNPYADDRRIHPFRSMSLGSLRSSTSGYQTSGRPDLNNNPQQLLYTTSSALGQQQQQRMDMDDNNPNKLTNGNNNNNNLSTYYGSQSLYSNTTTNNNSNGFPPLPSPSSMTSSPNTPMLSPVRQSFSQQPRHYSMSSTSSSSIPRYSNGSTSNRNSFDMMTTSNQHSGVHPHMIPEASIYEQRSIKTENDNTSQQQQGFSSSPNIGQLLNPVHPLHNANIVKAEPGSNNNNNSNNSDTTSSNNAQLFQPMGMNNNNASNYPQQQQQQQQQHTYGGNYYIQQQQQQQPLANTHSSSIPNNNIVPMFRNGMVQPQQQSMYDDTTMSTGPELGMEPLMLK